MQTLTIELTGKDSLKALQNLEQKDLIRIVKEPDPNLYSLSGEPMTDEDFKNWIEDAEKSPTLSLNEARQLWEMQKKKIQMSIR